MSRVKFKFSSIQIIRATAAFAVAFFHIILGQKETDAANTLFFDFNGAWGVDLFFVISGFIMVYINRDTVPGRRAVGGFFFRRAIRIVPLYWFYTFIAFIAFPLLATFPSAPSLTALVKSLFFIPDNFPVLLVGWTLNYEIYFYLIFALTLFFPSRIRLFLLSLWLGGTCLAGFMSNPFEVYWSFNDLSFYSNPIVLEFLAGIYIGYFLLSEKYLPKWICWLLITVSVASYFVSSALVNDIEAYRAALWGLPSAFIVYSFLCLEHRGLKAPRFLEQLGDSSYSLYLSHLFVVMIIAFIWRNLGFEGYVSNGIYIVVSVIAVLAISELSYRYIEKPSFLLLNQLIKPISKS